MVDFAFWLMGVKLDIEKKQKNHLHIPDERPHQLVLVVECTGVLLEVYVAYVVRRLMIYK